MNLHVFWPLIFKLFLLKYEKLKRFFVFKKKILKHQQSDVTGSEKPAYISLSLFQADNYQSILIAYSFSFARIN